MKDTIIKRCEHEFKECSSECLNQEGYFEDVKHVFGKCELIVYPTKTLYALGANPFHEKALNKVFTVKKRPRKMPISLAVSNLDMMRSVAEVNALAEKIFNNLLPGPVTLILKKKANLPNDLTGGSDKVGIRVPEHPVALKIIEIVGPITSTSANLHGHPEPKRMDIALEQLGDDVMLYFDCGECEHKSASTVVDVSDSSIKIIRKGVIPENTLLALTTVQS